MVSIKPILAGLLPAPVRDARVKVLRLRGTVRELLPAYIYDFRRYLRHSSSNGPYGSSQNLQSKITATYHNIEKGLSLPNPRPGFGVAVVANLIRFVNTYANTYGWAPWLATPVGVLQSYCQFNRDLGATTVNDDAAMELIATATEKLEHIEGGVTVLHREDVQRATAGVGLQFFATRSSVRQYSDQPVDPADIEFAAAAAQRAPAVCNRQYNRIYAYTDSTTVQRILEIQGGARGFAEELGGVAVIASDLRNFWATGERHQAWVDGGLFAMNFINGLHARGLGSVALNWSKTPETDRLLLDYLKLPEESVVIMLVGFGVLRDSYVVANSARVPVDQVLEIHA